jgi:hypothetical protein
MLLVTLFLIIVYNSQLQLHSSSCIFLGYFGYMVRCVHCTLLFGTDCDQDRIT